MKGFRNDSQDNESNDDGLELEAYNESMSNLTYVSVPDNDSDDSDEYIVPPKRRNVLRIDSDVENSEGDDEEHLEQIGDSSKSDEWEDVTEKNDLPFTFNFKTPMTISEYWTTRCNSKIPFYSEVFSRDRFCQIFWMLHLQGNASSNTSLRTQIGKANNFLQYIDMKFAEHFIPSKDICVDESVVKFKGKIAFITYIFIHNIADGETGYVYSILPYYGSLTTANLEKPELPVSSLIPLTLVEKLLNNIPSAAGYHLYSERYFTSIPPANELLKLKVHLTVNQLVGNFQHQTLFTPQPLTSFVDNRLNNQLHIIRSGGKKDCAVCSDRKIPGKRRQTHTYCDTGTRKPELDIGDCFAKYHSLEHYRD
ncbi:PiggyBac transposable element-derived protein 4, partial [Anthophora quadrimaculata]